MRGIVVAALILLAVQGPGASAQVVVRAPGGLLTGVVRDSASDQPVGFALVILVEPDLRAFASEGGRFTLRVSEGSYTLRVQQIGYAALSLPIRVETGGPAELGAPGILVRIPRRPFRLPEIVVEGDACSGSGEDPEECEGLLDLALQNAERLQTLQRSYPFTSAFQREIALLDEDRRRTGGWVDTARFDSRQGDDYRRGRVITRAGRGNRTRESARYFAMTDLVNPEFRRTHRVWYGGRDSVSGIPGFRINFAPLPEVKTPDWSGSLFLDSATAILLRSEARLVNLPPRGTTFRGAHCIVDYVQLAPTLIHEIRAFCATSRAGQPPTRVERWLLIHHEFISRRPPTGPDPPAAP